MEVEWGEAKRVEVDWVEVKLMVVEREDVDWWKVRGW